MLSLSMSYLRIAPHLFFFILVLITGFSSKDIIGNTESSIIFALFIAPLISWWGGSRMRGSFNIGNKAQKIAGFILGLVFLMIGVFWMWYVKSYVLIYGYYLNGEVWVIIGFLIGLIFTSKVDSR